MWRRFGLIPEVRMCCKEPLKDLGFGGQVLREALSIRVHSTLVLSERQAAF